MSFLASNYWESNFEYPEVTKIHREPIVESLMTIYSESKANSKMVYRNLSGGYNLHLGPILSPDKYNFVSLTPLIRLLYFEIFVISYVTTQFIVTAIKNNTNN